MDNCKGKFAIETCNEATLNFLAVKSDPRCGNNINAYYQCFGSGSAFEAARIRIRIPNADPGSF
jgi:hypothetical protein